MLLTAQSLPLNGWAAFIARQTQTPRPVNDFEYTLQTQLGSKDEIALLAGILILTETLLLADFKITF